MAYTARAHIEYNDAIRYFQGQFAYGEFNALQNHASWCKPCRYVLEEAVFDLEAAELMNSYVPQEGHVDMCIDLIQRLEELVHLGERKNALN